MIDKLFEKSFLSLDLVVGSTNMCTHSQSRLCQRSNLNHQNNIGHILFYSFPGNNPWLICHILSLVTLFFSTETLRLNSSTNHGTTPSENVFCNRSSCYNWECWLDNGFNKISSDGGPLFIIRYSIFHIIFRSYSPFGLSCYDIKKKHFLYQIVHV